MKKVGILSMQKVINYGSYLQAYGLKRLIENIGNTEVSFIDILPGVQLSEFKKHSLFGRLKTFILGNPFKILKYQKLQKSYYPLYKQSITNHWAAAGFEKDRNLSHLDIAIIGSDEVFNCCQVTPWGYTSQLYGDIKNADKVVSYAGSFGNTTYDKLQNLNITEDISTNLSKLDEISVRDKNSFECVKKLTGVTPKIHIDPVLAYGYKEEIAGFRDAPAKNYIVIYTYPNRIKSKREINAIKSFAKKHKLKIYSLMSAYSWTDKNIVADSPIDVLRWFKFANYIVTDTFHGTIFSIITHSRFATLVRTSNYNKLTSLLNQTGCDARKFEVGNDLESILCNDIDWAQVEKRLDLYRAETQQYLSDIIK